MYVHTEWEERMLATLAVVLALAGAPASTHVECNPQLPASVELGLTVSDEATVVDGKIVMGTLDHIELGPTACFALVYASVSPLQRFRMGEYTPRALSLVGVGLQVTLHEANHVALNSTDECLVEKTARGEIDGLISGLLDPRSALRAEAAATASDAGLPAQYHC